MNGQDSSQVLPPNNEKLILKNKIYNTFEPLVVMIGISKYKNFKNQQSVLNDYINVNTMLNQLIKYHFVFQNKHGKIIYDNNINSYTNKMNVNFRMELTIEEINKFNQIYCVKYI